MGKEYYTDIISEMDILSDKEKVELFKFYYRKGSKTSTFITQERSEKITSFPFFEHLFDAHLRTLVRIVSSSTRNKSS
jgi:hypothetical protein